MKRTRSGGFSLLEVVVVIAILGVIAGAAVPVVAAAITRSKVEETRAEMRLLVPAICNYFWDCRRLPASLPQLQTNSPSVSGWRGPYTTALLSSRPGVNLALDQDAWNQPYVLAASAEGGAWRPTSSTNQVIVRSTGPDLTANTGDDLVQTVNILFLRRKETVDELNILNTAIQAYNSQYLATDPLPVRMELLFEKLYARNLLPRPARGSDPLRTDGWGNSYVATPSGVTPVVRVISSNITGTAVPPPVQ